MSQFWSIWVIVLIVLNLGVVFFLFVFGQRVEIPTKPDGTTGHAWAHGVLREGVRRLPVWWVAVSAASFVAAVVYLVLYPGFGDFTGLLGWRSVDKHDQAVAHSEALRVPALEALDAVQLDQVASGAPAARIGRRLFLDNCAACHGMDASGNAVLGAPNLTDSVWLYGGDTETVVRSILDGRRGTMPPWGPALGQEGVIDVAEYVRSLSGLDTTPDWAAAGEAQFKTLCVACHGVDGTGLQVLGAPDLTDDDWLYGRDRSSVIASIRDGRNGEMPAWRGKLQETEVRAIAAWLFSQRRRSFNNVSRSQPVAQDP